MGNNCRHFGQLKVAESKTAALLTFMCMSAGSVQEFELSNHVISFYLKIFTASKNKCIFNVDYLQWQSLVAVTLHQHMKISFMVGALRNVSEFSPIIFQQSVCYMSCSKVCVIFLEQLKCEKKLPQTGRICAWLLSFIRDGFVYIVQNKELEINETLWGEKLHSAVNSPHYS